MSTDLKEGDDRHWRRQTVLAQIPSVLPDFTSTLWGVVATAFAHPGEPREVGDDWWISNPNGTQRAFRVQVLCRPGVDDASRILQNMREGAAERGYAEVEGVRTDNSITLTRWR